LQHAHNPVDWYPWNEEAIQKAKSEDKPILLSVGYAACHWCHVMEHESFEDEETARLMNELFVNIKVDREERPDIDSIYMTALQAMTGGGGWPMTIFMTPDGVPFYAGTYFPPDDRSQMPSFRRVLVSVAEAYRTRRDELVERGAELVERLREATLARLPGSVLTPAVLDEAYAVLHGQFDPTWGGFGRAPKFPQPMTLEFLLRYATRTGHQLAAQMLEKTLRAMAEGGMYDQVGGGFHRYSVDAQWLVPHFEKMLYDNALLARVFVETYQATGDPFYRRIAEETLDYLVREMRHPDGGFYSTQDADSLPHPGAAHKEEGAFFVWTPDELRDALGSDAMIVAAVYGVTDRGNFEGKHILHVRRAPAEVARVTGMPVEQVGEVLAHARQTLFAVRTRRPEPALDDKVLAAWNGMALRAFAQAATAFGRDDYRAVAVQCAEFLFANLRTADGTLLRTWRQGSAEARSQQPGASSQEPAARGAGVQESRGAGELQNRGSAESNIQHPTSNIQHPLGFLEDHALLADGLLALYEATFEERWLREAHALAETMLARFWDDDINGFYDTALDHETLVVRPRDTGDNATPSGNSAAADVLLRMAILFHVPIFRERALAVLGSMAQFMERYPSGFGRYLAAAEFALSTPDEIAIIGNPEASDTRALLDQVQRPFLPNKVVLLSAPGAATLDVPLLAGRGQVDGQATAYVCQNYACQLPVTDPAALGKLLEGNIPR
jgi:hypothetical protein